MFLGTTLYKSTSEIEKIIKRRKQVFYGSKSHFFKNLTHGIWDNNNFLLFKGSFQTNPVEHFAIEKEGELFKIKVLKNDYSTTYLTKSTFKSTLNLLYNKS